MRRFSSKEVSKASKTWRVQLFPKRTTTGVSASKRARTEGSSSGARPFRLVAPKAASLAAPRSTPLMRWKNSASLGLEPGHPLNEVDPEGGEAPRDGHLVVHGEAYPLPLGAVP